MIDEAVTAVETPVCFIGVIPLEVERSDARLPAHDLHPDGPGFDLAKKGA